LLLADAKINKRWKLANYHKKITKSEKHFKHHAPQYLAAPLFSYFRPHIKHTIA
jgi:hypothetical protein